MADTYTQIFLHFIFAVHNRRSLIDPSWKDELYKYITGIIQKNSHKLIAINGTANHLHILVGYKPHQPIPNLMQDVKGYSAKWINKKKLTRWKFNWQKGYGAFSYSYSHIDNVYKYIMNQEQHHKIRAFKGEYIELLNRFKIAYHDRYTLKDIS